MYKRLLQIGCAALACLCMSIICHAQQTTIRIRVLDGRSGKNLSGPELDFVDYHSDTTNDPLNGRTSVQTTRDGDAYIANPNMNGVLLFDVLGTQGLWVPCVRQKIYDETAKTYGSEHLYPVSTIVTTGLVTKNSCSNRTATANPGELVLFLRRTTLWEYFLDIWSS